MTRDSQRSRVYEMERRLYSDDKARWMNKKDGRQYFKRVCKGLGIAPMELGLVWRRGGVKNYYRQWDQTIRMRVPVRPESLLHEIAHHLVYERFGSKIEPHGAEFVGILLGLRITFEGLDPRRAWKEAEGLII
jgi:hypothetical protein